METKYDAYYEREIPYLMTLEEIADRLQNGFLTDEELVAYIRSRKEKFLCVAYNFNKEIKEPMKLVLENNDLFNPILDKEDIFHKNHWYHAYKLKLTPSEYEGYIEEWYVSDFTNSIRNGYTTLIEEQRMRSVQARFEEYATEFEYDTSKDENNEYTDMETYDAYQRFFANELAKEQ